MNELLQVVSGLLRKNNDNDRLREALVFASWQRIAGEKLCEFSEPLRLDGERLKILVRDETWKKQMTGLSGQLITKLNSLFGQRFVTFLEFRVDPKAFAETIRKESAEDIERRLEAIELSPAINEAASRIDDENLRRQFLLAAKALTERQEKSQSISR
jgi:hypothetical protein